MFNFVTSLSLLSFTYCDYICDFIRVNSVTTSRNKPLWLHVMNSDFLILVLYDFIVQNILSSLLLLCYNLMIMNDYE